MCTEENNAQNDQNRAEEPEKVFERIRFFNSVEEQKKEDIRWLASQTPEQHLKNTTALIKRVFAEDLKRHPEIGKKLYFD